MRTRQYLQLLHFLFPTTTVFSKWCRLSNHFSAPSTNQRSSWNHQFENIAWCAFIIITLVSALTLISISTLPSNFLGCNKNIGATKLESVSSLPWMFQKMALYPNDKNSEQHFLVIFRILFSFFLSIRKKVLKIKIKNLCWVTVVWLTSENDSQNEYF